MSVQSRLAGLLVQEHPDRAAAVLERFDVDERVRVLGRLPAPDAGQVLLRMSPVASTAVLERFAPAQVAECLDALELDACARLARRLGDERRVGVMEAFSARKARSLTTLLRFPEHSAGALSDPDVLALSEDLTAREALDRIRESARSSHYNLYVVDRQGVLVGALNLRELFLASPKARLVDLMVARPLRLDANATRTDVVAHPGWRIVHSLPVVDDRGHYVGAIRYATLRALENELFQRLMTDADTGEALGELFGAAARGVLSMLMTGSSKGRG